MTSVCERSDGEAQRRVDYGSGLREDGLFYANIYKNEKRAYKPSFSA